MITIRRMFADDIPAVLEIEESLCEAPWSYGIFSDCIRVGYHAWVICDTDIAPEECLIGYGILAIAADEAHLLNLGIHPQRQSQGLGTSLMQHLLKEAYLAGVSSIFLEVRVSNDKAFQLYQRLGFSVIGHRKDYYQDARGLEDALVLGLVF